MYSSNPRGHIDGFIGDNIYGWCACGSQDRVAIRIGGRELLHVEREIPRADVKVSLDLPTDEVGFEAYVPRNLCNGARRHVEILVISATHITIVASQMLDFPDIQQPQASDDIQDPKSLRRAAVVCWDLAHNPAGRALVLYEILNQEYEHVDLIGPTFPRFGRGLWEPLRGLNLNVVSREVADFTDLLRFSEEAASRKYGMVWICKPRLPALLIGLQIAESSKCRVALDIDDYEMSFFKDKFERSLTRNIVQDLHAGKAHPADFEATAFSHSFIDNFKLRTVSNISLQRTFGGEIIPHGRAMKKFDPALYNKDQERTRLGLQNDKTVIGFIGTVRKHKGIMDIARAVGKLKRDDVQLYVAGTFESEEIKKEIMSTAAGRAVIGGSVPFEALPNTLSACDIICLPQDVDSETSAFQLPAKLVDGLALGLKVIVNDLPTYDDLSVHPSLFVRQADQPLEEVIELAISRDISKDNIRDKFVEHLSIESLAIRATSLFNSIPESESIEDFDHIFEAFYQRPLRSESVSFVNPSIKSSLRDLVVLWKQIDSGLFGRRIDMVGKYLKDQGGFDRVFIIDAPLTTWEFNQLQNRSISPGLTNARMLYEAFVKKFFGIEPSPGIFYKTFITSESGERVLGRIAGKRADLRREIKSYLSANDVASFANLLVYPVASHLPDVISSWNFSKIVVDLVDDERDFTSDIDARKLKHDAYIEALCLADLVFTNNDNMRRRFQPLSTKPIKVVPNGVERFNRREDGILHLADHSESKTIVGYLGNLRDRIDSHLLMKLAAEVPDIHLLLVGPTGGNRDIERLRFHPNITMTGARSYEESRLIAAGFDVGIIPHTLNSLTDSMNPLKFFLYRELDIPVVTTPIKNLGSCDDFVFASDGTADDFVRLVKLAIDKPRKGRSFWRKKPKDSLWSSRVESMLKVWNS